MKRREQISSLFALIAITACAPALRLHEGDQFEMPYTGSSVTQIVDLKALSPGQKVTVQRCGDVKHDYRDMENVKPVFDRLIHDAEEKSGAKILKDIVITVRKSKCVELEAIPLLQL